MENILTEGLQALGIPAEQEAVKTLAAYGRLLADANRVTNLTAITDPADMARLHFLDSAALLTVADFSGRRVADIGSGAGFPGVPLRVLQPDMHLTVIDSVGKKVDFVDASCRRLGIENVNCIWGRAEELPQLRERFDIVVSRAVAELDVLAELCLPLVTRNGLFIAMKGPDCREEAEQAEYAIRTLGGRLREIRPYVIPGTDITHTALIVEKTAPTPMRYPRRYAQIKKNPLRGS
ncbi:MAG: 16S rRNA (guanine(527)-N(7))-methyltransferase RsmG [Oscillospiraceae bacterium]|nr:16S rRNA (guanine(527)-N(7))-methyltransferase RsmG [Oscillospiraceae bacterium]